MIRKAMVEELAKIANDLRIDVIKMTTNAGSGHVGGSFSIAEIVATLYFKELRLDPKNPQWDDRDRLVLSKGHCCPVVYAALARRGFFGRDVLWTLRKLGSSLQGHPDMRKTPGIDITSGSLGQGLSAGLGMALGAKLARRDFRVFIIIGDGEVQEGMVWEAAMYAAHRKLDNLVAIVDKNGFQCDGSIEETVRIEPLAAKWRAFGWETLDIDGHNIRHIVGALDKARAVVGKPVAIIARTVKGKGVSFMENNNFWHGGNAPSRAEAERALKELGAKDGMTLD